MEKPTVKNTKGSSGKKETPYNRTNASRGPRKKSVVRLSKVKYE